MKVKTRLRQKVTADAKHLTVHAPMTFQKHGHRKQIRSPENGAFRKHEARFDSTLIKALVRAFRWRDLLESGAYSTIRELANAERINDSYVCRVLRLSLLQPSLVENILNGKQHDKMELKTMLEPIPFEWAKQIPHLKAKANPETTKNTDFALGAYSLEKK